MTDSAPTTESLLPYATWTEEALRAVVRDALEHVAEHGLPGEHHFYLTFRTAYPGVVVPGHLKARYPQEITIVLQHRFWDLKVDRAADRFSVGLSFSGVAAKLLVPFAALTAFADPQVRFGLRFQGLQEAEVEAPAPVTEARPRALPAARPRQRARPGEAGPGGSGPGGSGPGGSGRVGSGPGDAAAQDAPVPGRPAPQPAPQSAPRPAPRPASEPGQAAAATGAPSGGADQPAAEPSQVVNLAAFRRRPPRE